jgi:hypothetical protein
MSDKNTKGIRTALREIQEKEGGQAALTTAYRWAACLEEISSVACPTLNDARPGGSQKFCAEFLLLRVNQYIESNPLSPKLVAEDADEDPSEQLNPEVHNKGKKKEKPNPDDAGKGV